MLGLLARPRRGQNTVARAARYLGLSAWFGGAVMRLLAAEPAAETIADPRERAAFLHTTRTRWRPAAIPAVAAHVAGSAALGWAGRHRGAYQEGMPTAMAVDTACSTAAVAAGLAAGTVRGRPGFAGRLEPLLAGGSLLAQGYLAEQQRPSPTLGRLRGVFGRVPVARSPVARAVQDIGLAAAFGGALMARVGLGGAVTRVPAWAPATSAARARWWPAAVAAMTAHLAAQARLRQTNRARLALQTGARTVLALQAGAGAGGLIATLIAARLAHRDREGRRDDDDAVATPLRVAEWAVVGCGAAMLLADAKVAEQQRPLTVARGFLAAGGSRRRHRAPALQRGHFVRQLPRWAVDCPLLF